MTTSTAEYIWNNISKTAAIIGAALIFYYMPKIDERTLKTEQRLERVEECLYQNIPRFRKNTIGDPKIPEEGYYINGERIYLSIDGMSVEDYFKNQREKKMKVK